MCSPRAEAVSEAEHLVNALHADHYPFAGLVVNLIHPLPDPLDDDDVDLLAELEAGPLADHVAWHAELSRLAMAEREELVDLEELAGDVPIVELPLFDVDIHDVAGLAGLAERLLGHVEH